jgi:ribosome biogenesis GTPase
VGKSTIVNHLFGQDLQKTGATSEANGKGRHTTTGSQLLVHERGYAVIDTPGMRELQLWADEEVLMESFQDIHALAVQCRYRDCRHEEEDHCRLQEAIKEGVLDAERFLHYRSQQKELQTLQSSRESYYKDRTKKKKGKRVRRNGVDPTQYASRE